MLEKGALELVDHLGLGYYSRLLLVQKATGGWNPVIKSWLGCTYARPNHSEGVHRGRTQFPYQSS